MGRRPDPKPRKVTIVRYETPQGKRCEKGDPGAVKVRTESDTYYVSLPDLQTGKPAYESLGTSDLAVAWMRLRELLQERKQRELGLIDERTRQASRPIAEHVEDWLAAVSAGGATAKHVETMRSRVLRLVEAARWKRVTEIRRSSCQLALAALQAEATPRAGEDGRSAQTRNHYLSHARQFARWLKQEGRLADDPLDGMRGVSVEADRRHDRRSPEELEVRVLFEHLAGPDAPARKGMSGERRALGYAVSMCTGLRANELRSLRPESFDLGAGEVKLRAARAKNRKRTLQPLPSWLCQRLRDWLAGGGGLWEAFPENWPGRLLRDDLARAREGWIAAATTAEERSARAASTTCLYRVEDEHGPLYLDFHALRHWYVTQLSSQQGISPATMQALARHSDPKLTLGVYSHASRGQLRDAVDQIRPPGAEPHRSDERP